MKTKLGVLLAGLVSICCAQSKPFDSPVRHASRGTHGAVAAGSEYATEAGMRMYYEGGNAVDAGIATMLAASVTEFSHFGLGGEAPILVRTKDGKVSRHRRRGHHAETGHRGFLPQPQAAGRLRFESPPERQGLKDWVPVAGFCRRWCPAWWRRRW